MIELVVTMVITSMLAMIGSAGALNWRNSTEHRGSAQELVSSLRKFADRSVTEGRTYCVDVTPRRSYSLWQHACGGTGTLAERARQTQSSRVTLAPTATAPGPSTPCLAGDSCIYFFPRGTATPATIVVRSSTRDKIYTVVVEGLTARVYQ